MGATCRRPKGRRKWDAAPVPWYQKHPTEMDAADLAHFVRAVGTFSSLGDRVEEHKARAPPALDAAAWAPTRLTSRGKSTCYP